MTCCLLLSVLLLFIDQMNSLEPVEWPVCALSMSVEISRVWRDQSTCWMHWSKVTIAAERTIILTSWRRYLDLLIIIIYFIIFFLKKWQPHRRRFYESSEFLCVIYRFFVVSDHKNLIGLSWWEVYACWPKKHLWADFQSMENCFAPSNFRVEYFSIKQNRSS